MKLIGLTGLARVGKDTAADYLAENWRTATYAFAKPIKQMLIAMGVCPTQFNGEQKEQVIDWIGKSPRELMQTLGTEWGLEMVASDIWIRCADRVHGQLEHMCYPRMVITDVRTPNEAEYVKIKGGVVVHITRDGAELVRKHVTENGIPDNLVDFVIDNNGTIEQFYGKLDTLMKELTL